jgi:hypothetical protein
MPNGKPGDHPLTDVLVHGMTVFGPRADDLIREIANLGGKAELDQHVDLYRLDPRFSSDVRAEDIARLEAKLTQLRDELRGG